MDESEINIAAVDRAVCSSPSPSPNAPAPIALVERIQQGTVRLEDVANRSLRRINRRVVQNTNAINDMANEINTNMETLTIRIDQVVESVEDLKNQDGDESDNEDFGTPGNRNATVVTAQQETDECLSVNVLTTVDPFASQLPACRDENLTAFDNWAQKFRDLLEYAGTTWSEKEKLGRLKFSLEGPIRKIFDKLPNNKKDSVENALDAIREKLDSPQRKEMTKRALMTCRQRESETVREFMARLSPLVSTVCAGQSEALIQSRLRDEFLERVKPNLAFLTRLTGVTKNQDFEAVFSQAQELELLLSNTNENNVSDPLKFAVQALSPASLSQPKPVINRLPSPNVNSWQSPNFQTFRNPNTVNNRQVRFEMSRGGNQGIPNHGNFGGGPSGSNRVQPWRNNMMDQRRDRFRPRDNRNVNDRNWSGRPKCFHCGRLGHRAYDCRDRRAGFQGAGAPNSYPVGRAPYYAPVNMVQPCYPHQINETGQSSSSQNLGVDVGALAEQLIQRMKITESPAPSHFSPAGNQNNSCNALIPETPDQSSKFELVESEECDDVSPPSPIKISNWGSTSIGPQLSRILMLSLTFLMLFAINIDALHSHIPEHPLICQTKLQGATWELPRFRGCPLSAFGHTHVPVPQRRRIYTPNFLEYSTEAWACRIVRKKISKYTSLTGVPVEKFHDTEHLKVPLEECTLMISLKKCYLGSLNQKDELYLTDNQIDLTPRMWLLGSFSWAESSSENCYLFKTLVNSRFGDKIVHSPLGQLEDCPYGRGSCTMSDKTQLIWEPESGKNCEYRLFGSYNGHLLNNTWLADEIQLALTDPPGRPTVLNCNGTLRVTEQKLAYQISKNGRQARRKRSTSGFVTSSQLASELTYLDAEIAETMAYAFKHAAAATCDLMEESHRWAETALLIDPTTLARMIFKKTQIVAKRAGASLLKIWPCIQLNAKDYRFVPTSSETECYELIPLAFKVHGGENAAFLNPQSMDIVPFSRKVSCSDSRKITLQLNGEILEVDQVTAKISKVTVLRDDNFRWTPSPISQIPTHAFHHLVMMNVTDFNFHAFVTNMIKTSDITYQIHQRDTKLSSSFSSGWERTKDELEKEIFGDWSTIWKVSISIIAIISLTDILIRFGLLALEIYAGDGRLGRLLVGNPGTALAQTVLQQSMPSNPIPNPVAQIVQSWERVPSIRYVPVNRLPPTASEMNSHKRDRKANNECESVFMLRLARDHANLDNSEFVPAHLDLPIILIKVNGVEFRALVDSASETSVATERILSLSRIPETDRTPVKTRLRSFGTSPKEAEASGKDPVGKTMAWAHFAREGNNLGKAPLIFMDDGFFEKEDFEIIIGANLIDRFGGVTIVPSTRRVVFGKFKSGDPAEDPFLHLLEWISYPHFDQSKNKGPRRREPVSSRLIWRNKKGAPNEKSKEHPGGHQINMISATALGSISPNCSIIEARINSTPIQCLIDTGASISIAPKSMARKWNCSSYPTSVKVISASGHTIILEEKGTVTFSLGNTEIEVTVHFVDDSKFKTQDYKALIGCDVLEKLPPLTFDYRNKRFQIGDYITSLGSHKPGKELMNNLRIEAKNSFVIPPNLGIIVKAQIDSSILPENPICIHTLDDKLLEENFGLIPVISAPCKGTVEMFLMNPTEKPVQIYKGKHLAYAGEIKQISNGIFSEDREEIVMAITDKDGILIDPQFEIDFSKSSVTGQNLEKLKELCAEFQDVFSRSQYDLGSFTEGEHNIITTTEDPVSARPRRTPYRYREELQKHIDQLLKSGVMVESDTPWVTPFVIVQKKDGGIRPCLDFRRLNEVTVPDHYPLPRMDAIMERVANCHFYTSLDLSSGYLQIKLSSEASRKCGVITEDRVYQMTHMPFGLKNATAAFSRAMARVLTGLNDDVIAYVDDILIFTKSPKFEEHISALRKVFERFRQFNLKLSPKKCIFATSQMNFLGHILDSTGYRPSLSRIEIIKNLPEPLNVKEIKRVVGMASFYRRHIPNFSTIVEPLTRLTRKNTNFRWEEEQKSAFHQIKELLSQEPSLTFPDYSKPFHIFTDASLVGQAGILMQKNETGTFSAVSYCSRTLSASERKWPPVQVELGAIIYALREFRPYIFMSDVELHTDHKPLAYLLKKAEAHPNLARWLIELQGYQIKIVHIAGKQNSLADALSRVQENVPIKEVENLDELEDIAEFPICLSLSIEQRIIFDPFINNLILRAKDGHTYHVDMKKEQRDDPQASKLIKFLETGEFPVEMDSRDKETLTVNAKNLALDSGILYFKYSDLPPKIYIPISLRSLVFDAFHCSPLGGGHMDLKKTLKKCRKYYWPLQYSDILTWYKQCITCQLRHSPTPAYRAEMQMVPANTLFARVGLDLAGPFPVTNRGNKYILNIIGWFCKYVISVPLPDAKSQTIAKAFLVNCYLKFGGCTELVSDNATGFSSEFFRDFCALLYINKKYAVPYWSQGNAATERTFRTFNNILAKYITKEQPDFDEFLEYANFCYNTSVHSSTQESPYFLVFGRDPIFCVDQILNPKIRDPIAFTDETEFKQKLVTSLRRAWKSASEVHADAQERMKIQYDKTVRSPALTIGDRVLMKNYAGKIGTSKKFHMPWRGIFRIIELDGIYATITSCNSPQSNPRRVHVNQLKKCIENLGPACTRPSLDPEEKAALCDASAEEISDIPGHSHPNLPSEMSPDQSDNELEESGKDIPAPSQNKEIIPQRYELRSRAKLTKPTRYVHNSPKP